MRKTYRVISTVVLLSFLFNTTIYGGEACPVATTCITSNQPIIDELAAGSMCNGILGLANKDRGSLMLALETSLLHFAEGKDEINIGKLLERAGEYRGSIFDKTHFFFSETTELKNDHVYVKCRIKDDKKRKDQEALSTRTYHATFSTKRDLAKGFDVAIYTDKEWKTNSMVTLENREATERYVEDNENNIDKFIAEKIAKGDFTEIEGRAELLLEWDKEEKYPDRIKPRKYLPKRVWEYIKGEWLNVFLEAFGTNLDEALKGKNVVFIRISSDKELPVITEAGQEIVVTTHASQNAVYIFLKEKPFNKLRGLSMKEPSKNNGMSEYLKIREVIRKKVVKSVVHIIGKLHDLEVFVKEKQKRVQNSLDIAWIEFQKTENEYVDAMGKDDPPVSMKEMFEGHAEFLIKEYPDLKKIKNGPVNLDTNLAERVYGGGYVSKKNIGKFLYDHTFRRNELEWLIEVYENKDWSNEHNEKQKGVLGRLKSAIVILNPKKKLKLHPNGWPKLQSIGGIETLRTVLSIQQAGMILTDSEEKEAVFESLPVSELKRAALLERDMEDVLREKLGMNIDLSLSNIAVDYYARRLKTINGMRKLNRVEMRRNPSKFISQPYDNVFDFSGVTLKTLTERDPIFIPCSTRMANGKEKKGCMLIDFSVSEKRIILTALTEEEADAVKCFKKYIKNFKRNDEDRRIMASYLEHEDKIDAVIDLAFRENRYMPVQTEKSALLDKITTELTELFYAINVEKDKKHYEKLVKKMIGKTYTLINIGKMSNLPQIHVRLTNGNEKTADVRMHTGSQGKYIFLTEDEYNSLNELNNETSTERERIQREMERWIVHDAGGVSFGLPATKIGNDKRVMNDLDCVYENWIRSKEKGQKYVYDEKSYWTIKEILSADNPIRDIEDLSGRNEANDPYCRDYSAGYFAKLSDKIPIYSSRRDVKRKKMAKKFIRKAGSFSTDELERLVDAYGDEQSYKTALANLKHEDDNKEYKKFQAVFVRLRKTLEAMKIKVQVVSHQDLRPRVDKIGGVETFKETLSLRRSVKKLINLDAWNADTREGEFHSLPGEELKTVALLKKDIWAQIFAEAVALLAGSLDYSILFGKTISLYRSDLEERMDWYGEIIEKKLGIPKEGPLSEKFTAVARHNISGLIAKLRKSGKETFERNYGTNTFNFSKMETLSDNLVILIPCFRSGNEGVSYKQYFAMIDFRQKDKVDIQILTQEEAELLKKMNKYGITNHLKRSAEDERLTGEYLLHEERIDDLVSGAIDKGKFHIIPEHDGFLKVVTGKLMSIFNKVTGKTGEVHEDLARKIISSPYTLINVGKESKLPRMPVRIKEKTKEVIVRMHTGAEGKYIFLTDEEFKSFHRNGDTALANKIEQDIKSWMIHDAGGVSLGLPVKGWYKGRIMNELDYAHEGIDLNGNTVDPYPETEPYGENYPTLKKILTSDNPIVNIHDLKGKNAAGEPYERDYTAGNLALVEEICRESQIYDNEIKSYWKKLNEVNDLFTLESLLKVFEYGDKVRYTEKERSAISRGGPDLSSFKKLQQELQENKADVFLRYKIKRIEGFDDEPEKYAKTTGIISAPPEANFKLFVLNDFVSGTKQDRNSEYAKDLIDYGSRFGIEKISTDQPDKIVRSILDDIQKQDLDPKNVVVQLPVIFSEEKEKYVSEIENLKEKAPGIKFMIVDTEGIKDKGTFEERKKYRRRIYSIMRLVGKMGRCRETYEESQVAGFLKYLIECDLIRNTEYERITAEEYISALRSDDISAMVNMILSCMPVELLLPPNYDENVRIFTFA